MYVCIAAYMYAYSLQRAENGWCLLELQMIECGHVGHGSSASTSALKCWTIPQSLNLLFFEISPSQQNRGEVEHNLLQSQLLINE